MNLGKTVVFFHYSLLANFSFKCSVHDLIGTGNKKLVKFLLIFFRSSESDFHYIKSYCPYQNIKDQVNVLKSQFFNFYHGTDCFMNFKQIIVKKV